MAIYLSCLPVSRNRSFALLICHNRIMRTPNIASNAPFSYSALRIQSVVVYGLLRWDMRVNGGLSGELSVAPITI